MSAGWENHEPAPIEFLHGEMMRLFHEYRVSVTGNPDVLIDGIAFNNIIAKAKTLTYKKYEKLDLEKTILKTDLT